MTPGQATDREIGATYRTVSLERLDGIARAGGREPARRWAAVASDLPGPADGAKQTNRDRSPGQDRCASAVVSVRRRSPWSRSAAGGAAPRRYVPGGSVGANSAKRERNRRRNRFRTTAVPTVRPMAKASRGGVPTGPGSQVTESAPARARRPLRRSSPKVAASRTRQTAVPTGSGREAVAALTAAGLQDGAAGAGGHPVAKAVVLGSLAVVGLERALHDASSLAVRGWRARQTGRRGCACRQGRGGLGGGATGQITPCQAA